jgi:hypothetical protein
MMNPKGPSRPTLIAPLVAGAALLGGCASFAPEFVPLGSSIDQARRLVVKPNAEYALPKGGTRLEFARGAFGKETYMLDFDAGGTLVAKQQVLTEENFATITPGLSSQEVRLRLGRPADVFGVPYQKLHVWNYRYIAGDCRWFQVSLRDADQRVTEASLGPDPACDGPKDGPRE